MRYGANFDNCPLLQHTKMCMLCFFQHLLVHCTLIKVSSLAQFSVKFVSFLD